MKKCSKCKKEKPLEYFSLNRTNKSGYECWCKQCKSEHWIKKQALKPKKPKRMSKYESKAVKNKILYHKNIEKKREYHRNWRNNNREKVIEADRRFKDKNRVEIRKRDLIIKKNKVYTPLELFKHSLRTRINSALRKGNYKKYSGTFDILGADFEIVKKHLERQFKKGMSWENRGNKKGFWSVDHKIPLSLAKNNEELIQLCHYTNLQPLWSEDNIKKSNKILPIQISMTL
jgi:hypothetical protein